MLTNNEVKYSNEVADKLVEVADIKDKFLVSLLRNIVNYANFLHKLKKVSEMSFDYKIGNFRIKSSRNYEYLNTQYLTIKHNKDKFFMKYFFDEKQNDEKIKYGIEVYDTPFEVKNVYVFLELIKLIEIEMTSFEIAVEGIF